MRSWGIWMLIIGVGAFILPLMGVQFVVISIFGEAAPVVAAVVAAIGLVLLVLSFKKADSPAASPTDNQAE